MLRTGMVASQAHGAIIAPLWLAFYQPDVMHRTTLLAQTARNAGIRGMEWLGRHQELPEQTTQHVSLDLRENTLETAVLVHHHPP